MSRDYVWMQVIGVLGETLVMYSFFDALLPAPPRTRKFRPWMAYLLFAAAFFTLKMITDNSIAGMLGFLLLAFAVSMVYAGNWKNKFALSVLLFLISGLSEMGVGMVLALQAPGSVANMKSDTLFYFQGMFISKLVELIIVKVIGRLRNKHVYALKLRTWFGIMLIPITNIIITYELYDIAYQSSDMRNKLRLFFIFLCMLATTAVAFHLFENELKIVERNVRLDMLEKQIANEQAYYKDIARTQTELQKTAHDMKNALLAVLGTVSDGNAPAAEGKLRDMLQVATDSLQTVYTGRATVDAMLNVNLDWSNVTDADEYEVYLSKNSGAYNLVGTVSNSNATISSLVYNTSYKVKIRAYNEKYDKYGEYSDIKSFKTEKDQDDEDESTTVGTVRDLNVKVQNRNEIALEWSAVSGADGYEVYLSENGGSYKLALTTKYVRDIITDLEYNTSYKVKVRAYKEVNGREKYGSYSSTRSFKTEKYSSGENNEEVGKVENVTANVTGSSVYLSWKSIPGAVKYEIQFTVPGYGGSSTIWSEGPGRTISGLTNKTSNYTARVRAYKYVNGRLVPGEYSDIVRFTGK